MSVTILKYTRCKDPKAESISTTLLAHLPYDTLSIIRQIHTVTRVLDYTMYVNTGSRETGFEVRESSAVQMHVQTHCEVSRA
jgi:hypothetical protein